MIPKSSDKSSFELVDLCPWNMRIISAREISCSFRVRLLWFGDDSTSSEASLFLHLPSESSHKLVENVSGASGETPRGISAFAELSSFIYSKNAPSVTPLGIVVHKFRNNSMKIISFLFFKRKTASFKVVFFFF
jgi:hypothetical protein